MESRVIPVRDGGRACDSIDQSLTLPRADRHQSEELLPFHSSPTQCCRGHHQWAVHHPAYVRWSLLEWETDVDSCPPATRYVTRHKKRQVSVIEASATEVDVRHRDFRLEVRD